MAKVFITTPIPDAGPQALRDAGHEVTVGEGNSISSRTELLAALANYDAVMTMLTDQIDAAAIAHAGPSLKIIANYAVGYDNIDAAAAAARGIAVTNTPDVLTSAVAEHTVALLAALARRIVEADRFTREGHYHGWQPLLLLGTELAGKTLGIVGVGRIGRDVARRTKHGFGMSVAYHDLAPNPDFTQEFSAQYYDTIEKLLPVVDAVTLHVPLLPTTRHLLNAARLQLMRPTALVINTARGPVIDEAALVKALQHKTIAGAALDVFEHEPNLSTGLAELPNVIVTPHIASATIETRRGMATLAAKNIIAVLAGQPPLNPVRQ